MQGPAWDSQVIVTSNNIHDETGKVNMVELQQWFLID